MKCNEARDVAGLQTLPRPFRSVANPAARRHRETRERDFLH